MTISYEDTQTQPLDTDDDITQRVGELIGRANTRQLWLLFLDDVNVQLPLLIPIDGLPGDPSAEQTERVVANIHELMLEIGASSVVTVWERYGAAMLTPQDAAWTRALRDACEAQGVHLRAMLLSHRNGVSWIEDDATVGGATTRASAAQSPGSKALAG
jgi:hypothetical protein